MAKIASPPPAIAIAATTLLHLFALLLLQLLLLPAMPAALAQQFDANGVPVPVLTATQVMKPTAEGTIPTYVYVGPSGSPDRAVFCFHGILRWWQECFVFDESPAVASSIIVAPYFNTAELNVGGNLVWSSNTTDDYAEGTPAIGFQESTFRILDGLIKDVLDSYPSVSQVTVVGFSAGAQMANRYAVLSQAIESFRAPVRFIVGSGSSFLFFDGRRLPTDKIRSLTDSPSGFEASDFVQFDVSQCAGVNKYKFGLEVSQSAAPQVAELLQDANILPRFVQRRVDFLAELDDTDENDMILSKGCASMAQGTQRLNRMLHYMLYLQKLYNAKLGYFTATGCGHDGPCRNVARRDNYFWKQRSGGNFHFRFIHIGNDSQKRQLDLQRPSFSARCRELVEALPASLRLSPSSLTTSPSPTSSSSSLSLLPTPSTSSFVTVTTTVLTVRDDRPFQISSSTDSAASSQNPKPPQQQELAKAHDDSSVDLQDRLSGSSSVGGSPNEHPQQTSITPIAPLALNSSTGSRKPVPPPPSSPTPPPSSNRTPPPNRPPPAPPTTVRRGRVVVPSVHAAAAKAKALLAGTVAAAAAAVDRTTQVHHQRQGLASSRSTSRSPDHRCCGPMPTNDADYAAAVAVVVDGVRDGLKPYWIGSLVARAT
ncbi:hypothetical protein DFJ73DRAFT_792257 [Zopfochytrium polystomum]|nr:hypothetical protein DFJ73DRAFT_792257 [Zopfochytrium polystomum]